MLRCNFERNIPFPIRCRSALLALPSIYADAESAMRDSPEVHRRDVHRTFQVGQEPRRLADT